MTNTIEISSIHKSYHDGEKELKVLRGVDFKVAPGEAVAIVGMSGAGKSTLLHLVGGLDRPDSGEMKFNGEEMTKWSRARMNDFRNKQIGFVFQFHHLLPEFNALENVMMPALVARRSRSEAVRRAEALLGQMGLAERLTHRPSRLSGGEQQRVALARALMNEPVLLLADEPTGNLDIRTGQKVIDSLWKATVQQNRSLIIVTHEPTIAQRADRVYLLNRGRLDTLKRDDVAHQMVQLQAPAEA